MSKFNNLEKLTQYLLVFLFIIFLFAPISKVIFESLFGQGSFNLSLFSDVLTSKSWSTAFINSLVYSSISALITLGLAFLLAYGFNFTKMNSKVKSFSQKIITLPMLLPTIAYGFALMYTFGSQGLLSQIFNKELFSIYGDIGLILGYVIYALPVSFILINNSMQYLDTRLLIVSRLMQDKPLKQTWIAIVKPLKNIMAMAFIQAFFMAFTDFGIPASVGGNINLITSLLYEQFLGAAPSFAKGSVIALSMLIPSIVSITLLNYFKSKNSTFEKRKENVVLANTLKDSFFEMIALVSSLVIIITFLVMFIVPFVKSWPYEINFTTIHVQEFFKDESLILAIKNSVIVALLTAIYGTIVAFLSGVFVTRNFKNTKMSRFMDSFALITNSVPGMVLGVGYMMFFSGSSLQATMMILVIVNVMHYFATPYQMAKDTFLKLNSNFEAVSLLMKDNWWQTLIRVIIPNTKVTIIEIFNYYFNNAMVTMSAVVFLTSASTMVMSAKIQELQQFEKFNEVFIISLVLLLINASARLVMSFVKAKVVNEKVEEKVMEENIYENKEQNLYPSLPTV